MEIKKRQFFSGLQLSSSQNTMTTTATTKLPSGIYHIVVAGGDNLQSQRLTDVENRATILPPNVDDERAQEVIHYTS